MEGIIMSWQCLVNTIPVPNSIIMVGEIDEGPISKKLLILRSLLYIEVGQRNLGNFMYAKPDKFNYPDAKPKKIVLQFQMTFPKRENLEKFIKEISLLN